MQTFEQSDEYKAGWANGFYDCTREDMSLARCPVHNLPIVHDSGRDHEYALGYRDGYMVRSRTSCSFRFTGLLPEYSMSNRS